MSLIEFKLSIGKEKIVFGTRMAIKGLQKKKIKKVFLPKDCPDSTMKIINEYAKLNKTPIVNLDKTAEELQEITKAIFCASVISILK